jgi:hypothetical protein
MAIKANNREKYDTIMLKTPLTSKDGEDGIPEILAGIHRRDEEQPIRTQIFGKAPADMVDVV